jgi:hypothetical protein
MCPGGVLVLFAGEGGGGRAIASEIMFRLILLRSVCIQSLMEALLS